MCDEANEREARPEWSLGKTKGREGVQKVIPSSYHQWWGRFKAEQMGDVRSPLLSLLLQRTSLLIIFFLAA